MCWYFQNWWHWDRQIPGTCGPASLTKSVSSCAEEWDSVSKNKVEVTQNIIEVTSGLTHAWIHTFIYAYIYLSIYKYAQHCKYNTYTTYAHITPHTHKQTHTHITCIHTKQAKGMLVVPPALSLHTILDLFFYCNYWRSYTVLKQGQKAFSGWENEIIVLKIGWKLGRAWTCKSFHMPSLELLESISGLQPCASKDLLRLRINRHWNLATLT